jgi:hypothetical protein
VDLKSIAEEAHERPPNPDGITRAAISYYELCRSLSDAYPTQFAPIMNDLKGLHAHLEERLLEAEDSDGTDLMMDLPRFSPEIINEPEFAQFMRNPCPIVLEGAARESEAVRQWTPSFFKERFGDLKCLLATETQFDIEGTLADAVDDILNNVEVGRYAQNIADIFNDNPELEVQLGLKEILQRLGPGRHMGSHLFMGGARTGTNYHCANNLNIFFNVHGEKEWFFVHPKHTFWMDGLCHKSGAYGDSPVDHRVPANQQAAFPLFAKVPVYRGRLGPGDVLINPNWWWHAVNNLTNASIAVAVRWLPFRMVEPNPVFSLVQRLVPNAEQVMKLLSDPHARFTDALYREQFEPVRKER